MKKLLDIIAQNNQISVSIDSRTVKPNSIFIAIKGAQSDGHDFIGQAIKNGAKYIVCEHFPDNCPADVEIIKVENSSIACGIIAQAANSYPSNSLTNLAVTGTNGKTTVAFLLQSIIETAGKKCGLIGTVFNNTGNQNISASMTTPDAVTIAQLQSQMVDAKMQYMAIEASSHSLQQNRLSAINFKAAAFTNLTGDHLDYHENFENYLAAKTKLFELLAEDSFAILNKQAPQSQSISEKTKAKILYYAVDQAADIEAEILHSSISGTQYKLKYNGQEIIIDSPLSGTHNVSNHLAAVGLAITAGFNLSQIKAGLEATTIIPGRLEQVQSDKDFSVFIDYAHTDDALENVLRTLQPLCKEKLITAFGCGGDRDKTKRPRMASIAEKLADTVIVTSDNPRTEDPEAIIKDILAGFDKPEKIHIESDREKAVKLAIDLAKADDIILIAGKGHEDYQIIGTEKIHFSDKEIATKYLSKNFN